MGFFASKEIDPICQMKVDPKTATETLVWEGKKFYFCSPGCKTTFSSDPARYAEGGRGAMRM